MSETNSGFISSSFPLSKANLLPPLVHDYLFRAEKVKSLYAYPPDMREIEKVIEQRNKYEIDRKVLADTVMYQYGEIQAEIYGKKLAEQLLQPNTYTITTAHQPNIFTGYLYVIYKVVSTIAAARELKKSFPDYTFIPTLWLGTEDHDIDELGEITIGNKKYKWETTQLGSVGRMDPGKLESLIQTIETEIQEGVYKAEILHLLRRAYTSFSTLGTATHFIFHSLFERYNLLVVNQDSTQLKTKLLPILEDEIFHQKVESILSNALQLLKNEGYTVQAEPRSINVFWRDENGRNRIEYDTSSQQFKVVNTSKLLTYIEMRKALSESIDSFSPNVMLRPLFQELTLPNLITIGGPSEVSYWLELKDVFEHFQVHYPMILFRDSAIMLSRTAQKKIEKAGLKEVDLMSQKNEVIKQLLLSRITIDTDTYKPELERVYSELQQKVQEFDPTLSASVAALWHQANQGLDILKGKIIKAEKQKSEVLLQQIEAVFAEVYPLEIFQERKWNLLPYFSQYGHEWIKKLVETFNPFAKEIKIMRLP